MNAYGALAASYDRLTYDVDYEGWVDFAQAILEREGLRPRTVADLACGTGSATRILAQLGYRVTAVDLSEDMLTEAMDKCCDLETLPTFVHQNLAELKLPRAVDMAVCFLDSLDYILDPADCEAAMPVSVQPPTADHSLLRYKILSVRHLFRLLPCLHKR